MSMRFSTRDVAFGKPVRLQAGRGKEDGFAVLVIFVLLTIMVVYVVSNALVLRHLHQEIKLVEKRQLKKFEAASVNPLVETNAESAVPEKRTGQ